MAMARKRNQNKPYTNIEIKLEGCKLYCSFERVIRKRKGVCQMVIFIDYVGRPKYGGGCKFNPYCKEMKPFFKSKNSFSLLHNAFDHLHAYVL